MRQRAPIFLDSFSGALCDLKTTERTEARALAVLARAPRVSCWDMETQWVRSLLASLTRSGLIVEDKSEPYPWLRYDLTEKGRAVSQPPQLQGAQPPSPTGCDAEAAEGTLASSQPDEQDSPRKE